MKDLIWTLIALWLIFKIIHFFSRSRHVPPSSESVPNSPVNKDFSSSPNRYNKKLPKGHYVDFEELQ